MQTAGEVDGAFGQILRQLLIQVNAQQHEGDGVRVRDVDSLKDNPHSQ